MNKNRLTVSSLHKTFFNDAMPSPILRGVNATFWSGQTYAIKGVSGSGKSTLLHLIAGFDTPTEGSVFFNDIPLDTFSAAQQQEYRQETIGFLFQKPYLIKELSVLENVMLPAQIAGISDIKAEERACELLHIVGLAAYQQYKPGVLSGGQQQKLSLARALCNKPLFLCADEPTASLDAANRAEMLALINYGVISWGMGVIVCTHDEVVAQAMSSIMQLHEGKLA